MKCLGKADAHPNFTLYHALGNAQTQPSQPQLPEWDEAKIRIY
jgi:hypothetical protein